MATVQEFVDAARVFDGGRYVYGGKEATGGLDCSGLITLALRNVGVVFPHGTENQIAVLEEMSVKDGIGEFGALLYMPGHIAISLGNGKTFEARNPHAGIGSFDAAGRGWTRAGRIKELTTITKESTMISPVKGTVSSEYGYRTLGGKRSLHSGIDIATGSQTGVPVYAAFAGTVVTSVSNRVHDTSSTQWRNVGKSRIASGLSGNGTRIKNPDGEQQVYGHMRPVASVRVGASIAKGQLIGHIDLSGYTTGAHLHFETWNSSGVRRNPRIWFTAHGVVPGSAPNVGSAPSPTPAPAPAENAKVKAYQKRQNKYGDAGLVEDGVRGARTIAWENWVYELQVALPAWNGVGKIVADRDYGSEVSGAVKTIQKRNGLTPVDGVAGERVVLPFMRSKGSKISTKPAKVVS